MMDREWTRVVVGARCGGCGVYVPPDAPVQVIRLAGLKRGLIRGECCVGQAPLVFSLPVLRASPIETREFRQRLERLSSVAARGFARQGSFAPLLTRT